MAVPPPRNTSIDINKKLREEQQLAMQKKQEEIKRQQEEVRQLKQKKKNNVLQAIDRDDIPTIEEYIHNGGNIHFIFERGPYAKPKYEAYNLVHSPEMVKFLMEKISPLHPDYPDFCKKMLQHAVYDAGSKVSELIEIAKQNDISLNLSLKDIYEAQKLESLVQIGADIQTFDFKNLYEEYKNFRDGFWRTGRDDDYWIKPEPKKAAEVRERLIPVVSRAAELGYQFQTTENSENKDYEYDFLAELAEERAEGQTFIAPLNAAIDIVAAAEDEKERQRQAELKAKQEEEERQQQIKLAQIKQKELNEGLEKAVSDDKVEVAADLLAQGAAIPLDSGNSYWTNLWHVTVWFAQRVKSAEMAELLLNQLDMTQKVHQDFAQEMFGEAIIRTNAPVDNLIALAQRHGVSLHRAMEKAANNIDTAFDVFTKLAQAGVDKQALDFNRITKQYYDYKEGFWTGRDGDHWVEPNPEKAAKLKESMLAIIENGYVIDKTNTRSYAYSFLQETEKEKQYDSFSVEDKKLITDLTEDNIDEIRKALNGGLLKHDIEDYVKTVPIEKGEFINHYTEMLLSFKKSTKRPATSLDEAEEYFIKNREFYDICRISKFKPTGLKEIIGEKFATEYIDEPSFWKRDIADAAVKNFKKLGAEYQVEVAKAIAPFVHKQANVDYIKILAKLYEAGNKECKDILRLPLLKYRVGGTNEERRKKAENLKGFLSKDAIKEDDTLKAVTETSLTPLSKLNRLLRKYGKDIEK